MINVTNNSVEILYCIASSADQRGRRVLIREGNCENVLWASDDIEDVSLSLLGISDNQLAHIQQFFQCC